MLHISFDRANYLRNPGSLFQMKITASATKSLHQDCGSCYLHVPIFFLYTFSRFLLENK